MEKFFLGYSFFVNLTCAFILLALLCTAPAAARAQTADKPDIKQLFLAIDRKDTAEFNRLIAAGIDLKATHGEGKPTALHQAAGFGTTEMIKTLLDKILIDERDASRRTPIFYAVAGKNLENLKFLVRAGANLQQKDKDGSTFDQYAEDAQIRQYIEASKSDTVRMWQALKANDQTLALRLMTSGSASPNAVFDNQTPLIFAALKGDTTLFDRILNAGGEVSTFISGIFPPYRTALDAAAEKGSTEMVRKILARNLGTQKTGILSNSLAAAIRGGRSEIIPLLLAEGANVNEGFDMNTPISEAARRGNTTVLENLIARQATKKTLGAALYSAFDAPNSQVVFQMLLDAGADVNYDLLGVSALTRAAEEGNVAILKLLTDKGADQNSIQNAFVAAAKKNQIDAMRLLMSLPAKPDLNRTGAALGSGTALIEAAKNSALEAVRFLVARGADINFVADGGLSSDTALTAAVRKDNAVMVSALLQLGANPKIAIKEGLLRNVRKTAFDYAANKPEILKLLQNPPPAVQTAESPQLSQTPVSKQSIDRAVELAIKINSAYSIKFSPATETFSAADKDVLRKIAEQFKKFPRGTVVQIGAHVFETADSQTNLSLSLARALTVKATLIDLGVNPKALRAKGYGDQMPIYDIKDPQQRQKNTRLEFSINQQSFNEDFEVVGSASGLSKEGLSNREILKELLGLSSEEIEKRAEISLKNIKFWEESKKSAANLNAASSALLDDDHI